MLRLTVHLLIIGILGAGPLRADPGEGVVKRWLATNEGVDTLRIEFTQTRKLNQLEVSHPAEGCAVGSIIGGADVFRWQTGDPPRTIVTGKGGQLLIIRPRSKQYERALARESRSSMAILAQEFPRSWERIPTAVSSAGSQERQQEPPYQCAAPRPAGTRFIRVLTFVTGREKGSLQAIEVLFRDGSSQQIAFDKVVRRLPLGPELFSPDLTGYQATRFLVIVAGI